jgi:hypothetical protein
MVSRWLGHMCGFRNSNADNRIVISRYFFIYLTEFIFFLAPISYHKV